jgi:hypothetical protein
MKKIWLKSAQGWVSAGHMLSLLLPTGIVVLFRECGGPVLSFLLFWWW